MEFLAKFNPFTMGGIWMFLILLVSVYTFTLIVERAYTLWFRYKISASQVLNQILSFVDANNYSRAIEVCNTRQNHPLSMVLKAGLMKTGASREEIDQAVAVIQDFQPYSPDRLDVLKRRIEDQFDELCTGCVSKWENRLAETRSATNDGT